LASAMGAVVVGHLAEASVGIPIVSTLMLLWTLFGLATVLYAHRELIGEDAFAAEPAAATRQPALAAAVGAYGRRPSSASASVGAVTVAARGRGRGPRERTRDADPRREGGENGPPSGRSPRGRTPARGQPARAA